MAVMNYEYKPMLECKEGISLRDTMAIEAMKKYLSAVSSIQGEVSKDQATAMLMKIPAASYELADAMLAERDKACEVKPMDKAEGAI